MAYFSRRMPRLRFLADGRERLVAFSLHALERICERTVYDWRTYGGHGDAFAFLDNCVYFEDCSTAFGEPCFAVYNSCVPQFVSWNYVDQVLRIADPLAVGEVQQVSFLDFADQVLCSPKANGQYYYRVGYCPVSFYEDMAKAITLLVPGMKRTPERKLIDRSGLPATKVVQLKAQVESQLSMKKLADSGDYSLVRWFQGNGVPQVVRIEADVFRYD